MQNRWLKIFTKNGHLHGPIKYEEQQFILLIVQLKMILFWRAIISML